MKKLFVLLALLVSININAQTIGELESRYVSSTPISTPISTPSSWWDEIIEAISPAEATTGHGLSYSPRFPLTLISNRTAYWVSIGTELGFNLDRKKYTESQFNPFVYGMISPGVCCKFLSINCGIGLIYGKVEKTTTHSGSLNGTDFSTEIVTDELRFPLIIKPSITGLIPISEEVLYLTINAGYNHVPKFDALNGWAFGIGLQVNLKKYKTDLMY